MVGADKQIALAGTPAQRSSPVGATIHGCKGNTAARAMDDKPLVQKCHGQGLGAEVVGESYRMPMGSQDPPVLWGKRSRDLLRAWQVTPSREQKAASFAVHGIGC